MRTYLTIWFNSEGTEPTIVVERLLAMVFKPIKGRCDHVYDWGRDVELDEILRLGNAEYIAGTGLKG